MGEAIPPYSGTTTMKLFDLKIFEILGYLFYKKIIFFSSVQ